MQTIWSNVLYFCHLFCNDFPLSDLVRSLPVSIVCFFELFLPSSFLIPDQVCLQSTYDDDDDDDDNDDNDDDGDDSTVCLPCNMAFTTRRPIACLCFCQKSSKTIYFGDALLASSTLMLPLLIVMVIMTTSMKKMMRTMKTMMRVLYVPNDDDDGEYVTIIMLMTMMMTTMTMLCVPYMGECTAEPVTTSLLSHISRSLPTALVITSRLSSDC